MSFGGLRRLRQGSTTSIASVAQEPPQDQQQQQQQSSSMLSNSNSSSSLAGRAGGLFRKKTMPDDARPSSATGPTASPSRIPRVHQRSPSSKSSIITSAATAQSQFGRRGKRPDAQEETKVNLSPGPSRKVYNRDDVARYRAGTSTPSTVTDGRGNDVAPLESTESLPPVSQSSTASTSQSITSPASPTPPALNQSNSNRDESSSTMRRSESQASAVSFPSSAAATAPSGADGQAESIQEQLSSEAESQMLRDSAQHSIADPDEVEDLQDADDTARPTAAARSQMVASPQSAGSVLREPSMDVRRDPPNDRNVNLVNIPGDLSGDIQSHLANHSDDPTEDIQSRLAARRHRNIERSESAAAMPSTNPRRSIFEWGTNAGPSLVRKNSRPLTNERPPQAAPPGRTASALGFLRTASSLGHRREDSEQHSGVQRPSRHERIPSTVSNLSMPSGIPLFNRSRTASQSMSNGLSRRQQQQQQQQEERDGAMTPSASASPSDGRTSRSGLLSGLAKMRSKDNLSALAAAGGPRPSRSSPSASTQRQTSRGAADEPSIARASTSLGNYSTEESSLEPQRRPSTSSFLGWRGSGHTAAAAAAGSEDPENSASASGPNSRRKRIASIYSLGPSASEFFGSSANLTGDKSPRDETGAGSGSGAGTGGWRSWVKGRSTSDKTVAHPPPQAPNQPPASANEIIPLTLTLSPNANASTRKWAHLPDVRLSANRETPSLIFGVPLRAAVVRTRFISPMIDADADATASSSGNTGADPQSEGSADALSSQASAKRLRRRPSKIGLLDLGSDFGSSSDFFAAQASAGSSSGDGALSSLGSPSRSSEQQEMTDPLSAAPAKGTPRKAVTEQHRRPPPVDRATARQQYLPRFVTRCIESLETYGPDEEGVYRLSGRSSHTQRIRLLFDGRMDLSTALIPMTEGRTPGMRPGADEEFDADLDLRAVPPSECDLNSVCSAFKAYLRELPTHILGREQLNALDTAAKAHRLRGPRLSSEASADDVKARESMTEALRNVPPAEWYLLHEIVCHLADLTQPDVVARTKMTLNNLSLVLAPTLFIPVATLNFLVQQRELLFAEGPMEDDQLDNVREGDVIGGSRFNVASPSNGSSSNRRIPRSASGATILEPLGVNSSPSRQSPSRLPVSVSRKTFGDISGPGPGPVPRLRQAETHHSEQSWRDGSLQMSSTSSESLNKHRESQASMSTVTGPPQASASASASALQGARDTTARDHLGESSQSSADEMASSSVSDSMHAFSSPRDARSRGSSSNTAMSSVDAEGDRDTLLVDGLTPQIPSKDGISRAASKAATPRAQGGMASAAVALAEDFTDTQQDSTIGEGQGEPVVHDGPRGSSPTASASSTSSHGLYADCEDEDDAGDRTSPNAQNSRSSPGSSSPTRRRRAHVRTSTLDRPRPVTSGMHSGSVSGSMGFFSSGVKITTPTSPRSLRSPSGGRPAGGLSTSASARSLRSVAATAASSPSLPPSSPTPGARSK